MKTHRLAVTTDSQQHVLRAKRDKDPETRARGTVRSQLWNLLEKHSASTRSDWLRASAVRGGLIAEIDGSGRTHLLFKCTNVSDTPDQVLENLEKLSIDADSAHSMIKDAAAEAMKPRVLDRW